MDNDKAARLAAIRAANAAKREPDAQPQAPPAPQDKAARLAAIRAANAAKAQPSGQPEPQPTTSAVRDHATQAPASRPRAQQGPAPHPATWDEEVPIMAGEVLVGLLLAIAGGTIAASLAIPRWVPGLTASISGPEPSAFWYLARSSGLVAYGLLWLAMVWGLAITSRSARLWPGGPTALALHQHASILGCLFGVFHALILLGDHYMDYSLAAIALPFASGTYKPFWVGLGQIALYGMGIIVGSFYIKKQIGRRAWRLIHGGSFAIFLIALSHGVKSGSDTGHPWVVGLYWASAGSVLALTIYRVLVRLQGSANPALSQPSR